MTNPLESASQAAAQAAFEAGGIFDNSQLTDPPGNPGPLADG